MWAGNGGSTSFWKDTWKGSTLLPMQFPRFFYIAKHQQASIRDMWVLIVFGGLICLGEAIVCLGGRAFRCIVECVEWVLLFASGGFVVLEAGGEWIVLGQFNV